MTLIKANNGTKIESKGPTETINVDFTTEMEGRPGCYPIVDISDRAGAWDKIHVYTNYFDSVNEEFHFDIIICANSAPGIKEGKPLEDPSHIPGFAKYGRMYNRQ